MNLKMNIVGDGLHTEIIVKILTDKLKEYNYEPIHALILSVLYVEKQLDYEGLEDRMMAFTDNDEKEIANVISLLQSNGLILKEGEEYILSDNGKEEFKKVGEVIKKKVKNVNTNGHYTIKEKLIT